MDKTPTSISDLIDRWKTIGDFAHAIGCGYEAARQMRNRESIAPDHWASVVREAEKMEISGVTYEWLAEQRERGRKASHPNGEGYAA